MEAEGGRPQIRVLGGLSQQLHGPRGDLLAALLAAGRQGLARCPADVQIRVLGGLGQQLHFDAFANLFFHLHGEKHVVLSTVSWMGGKNPFLGYAYVVVGAICIALALLFLIKNRLSPRRLGDPSYITNIKKEGDK